MAIIRVNRRNSPSQTLLKVLSVLTEDIQLTRGEILMSQFRMVKEDCATKLSLYLEPYPDAYIGVRNVWLQDSGENVIVTFANEREGIEFVKKLSSMKYWSDIVPKENKNTYKLDNLDQAAEDIRNFLLLGVRPSEPLTEANQKLANELLKVIEFDVLASLDSGDDALL